MADYATLAIIPARGGSKRIARKNIRPFLGVPLVARPIQTLIESAIFDYVVVSTDDDEIAAIAEAAGAWVPFRRPAELADDFTPTVPVILDAADRVEQLSGNEIGELCVVYPAAVFMTKEHLIDAQALLRGRSTDVVMSATEFPAPIQRAWRQSDDAAAEMIWPEHRLTRSQDLEPAYFDAGQFYWWSRDARSKLRSESPIATALFKLPPQFVQDIDTEADWDEAERKYRHMAEPS